MNGVTMKKFKVVLLEDRHNPVPATRIDDKITEMTGDGWTFVQLNSGGGGDGMSDRWVYLAFERE